MTAWYNEHDRQKAAWLRHLIEEGAIARGVVDERSITEIDPDDLRGFDQCHFFAGVGVWSYALRLAGWPDDRPVWTGSCPCGPFSRAGKQEGFADPRHLWPAWLPLIRERRPDRIFGEQSDAADAWVDLVSADLEDNGYAIGSPDIPAAGFGGAHIRQRFFWVADANDAEWWSERAPWHDGHWPKTGRVQGDRDPRHGFADGGMADADGGLAGNGELQRSGQHRQLAQDHRAVGGLGHARGNRSTTLGRDDGEVRGIQEAQRQSEHRPAVLGGSGSVGGMADTNHGRREGLGSDHGQVTERSPGRSYIRAAGLLGGAGVDWLLCRDGSWRPVESGSSPLVDASPARMGRLRGYGDAIDAEAAANFVGAYMDAAPASAAA